MFFWKILVYYVICNGETSTGKIVGLPSRGGNKMSNRSPSRNEVVEIQVVLLIG